MNGRWASHLLFEYYFSNFGGGVGWGVVFVCSAPACCCSVFFPQLKAANLLSDLASKGHLFKILHKQTNKQNKVTENLSINKKQNKM